MSKDCKKCVMLWCCEEQLADQKTKMIQIINNTKLCVSGITAQREFRSRLLKEFEELTK